MDQVVGGEGSSLREVIHHPAHQHAGPLTLFYACARGPVLRHGDEREEDEPYCSICSKQFGEQHCIYRCPDPNCNFKVDVSCSSMRSIIEFNGHSHHPLCFVEEPAPGTCCSSCRKKEPPSDPRLRPMIRCGQCGFGLHLLCGPMPRVVRYRGYELVLTDSLLNGVDADDCWCDICEQQRDPAQCVYHSTEIRFTGSIDCLLPQVLSCLTGVQSLQLQ